MSDGSSVGCSSDRGRRRADWRRRLEVGRGRGRSAVERERRYARNRRHADCADNGGGSDACRAQFRGRRSGREMGQRGLRPRRGQRAARSDRRDRKSTRLTPVTNAHLVCRLLLEKKKKEIMHQTTIHLNEKKY